MAYELGRKMRIGALWTYIRSGFRIVFQFAATIVLARILDPSDFGVFAAVSAYLAIIMIQVRFSMPMALLQAKSVSEQQWNSVFIFMEGIAIVAVLLVLAMAPYLEDIYHDERYANIMYLMCINLFIIPYTVINSSILKRDMDYKYLSQAYIAASIIAPVISIVAALNGLGPYSLVIGGIVSALMIAVIVAHKVKWRPQLHFDRKSLGSLFSFAWKYQINITLVNINSRIDVMLVGGLINTEALGLYMRAKSLANMPLEELLMPMKQLVFTAYSGIQEDLDHSLQMYQKVLCALTSAVYPMLLVVIFTADGLIVFIYGEKWLPAALPLKIIACGVFVGVISASMETLASAQNLVGRQIYVALIGVIFAVIVILAGSNWGLEGVATGVALIPFSGLLLNYRLLSRSHVELKWRQVLNPVYPSLYCVVIAATIGMLANEYLLSIVGLGKLDIMYVLIMVAGLVSIYSCVWILQAYYLRENAPLQASFLLVKQVFKKFQGNGA